MLASVYSSLEQLDVDRYLFGSVFIEDVGWS